MAPVVDPDSDSDKEHPLHGPQFVFHAVDDDDDDDERHRQPDHLLPIRHRRPLPAAVDKDREERLRAFMLGPQAILCGWTFIFVAVTIYLANTPDLRDQPDFNGKWNVFVTVSSAMVMLFSLVSLLLSYLGVYRWLR